MLMLCPPALSENVKACGAEALALLGPMREQETLSSADGSRLRDVLQGILATAEVSGPPSQTGDGSSHRGDGSSP